MLFKGLNGKYQFNSYQMALWNQIALRKRIFLVARVLKNSLSYDLCAELTR